jgi:hypothetical protein
MKKMKKNKEVNIKYLGWLLESAVSNVLAEQAAQQAEQQVAPVAAAQPPASLPAPTDVAPVDPNAPAAPPAQVAMSLDDLIEKLNLIRGGRSFTDPEVYTKMGEVFKTFTDQQKTNLDASLSKVIDVIVNPDEQQPAPAPAAPPAQDQAPQNPPPAPQASPAPAPTQQTPII